MRKKIAVVAVAGGIGLTGGLLMAPSIATADNGTPRSGVSSRVDAIKDALKGLVSDKTLTPGQADKVAQTLDQKLPRRGPMGQRGGRMGHHMRGPAHLHPAAVAKALGMTVDQVRTQLEAGKTLAQIAQAKGISKATLVDRLVKAVETDLAQDVKDGKLTQAQADAMKSGLKGRITSMVDRVGPGRMGGRHPMGPPPPADAPPGGTAEPSGMMSGSPA